MALYKFKIPDDYKPLKELIFCSNKITNSTYIINDNGFIPLLIGKGDDKAPRIWLYAKEPKFGFIPVIEDNVSKMSQIKFDHYKKAARIKISVFNKSEEYVILELLYRDVPLVIHVDLRPIGYNIQGNQNSLNVGTSELRENSFNGLETVIGFEHQASSQHEEQAL